MNKKILAAVTVLAILTAGVFAFIKIKEANWLACQKKYAASLLDRGLDNEAAEAYQKILDRGHLSNTEEANLSYIVGRIYFDKGQYEKALAAFLKVEALDPKNSLIPTVNEKKVICLENLGKPLDARQELEKNAFLNPPQTAQRESVVAKIGKREITISELEKQIRLLPPYMQSVYTMPEKKLEFLKQYVATELLYESARRRGLEADPEILERMARIKKSLMVEKMIEAEVGDKIHVSDAEVKDYYESHKKDLVDQKNPRPFEEIAPRVREQLAIQKSNQAQEELLQRLIRAENVQFFENVLGIREKKK